MIAGMEKNTVKAIKASQKSKKKKEVNKKLKNQIDHQLVKYPWFKRKNCLMNCEIIFIPKTSIEELVTAFIVALDLVNLQHAVERLMTDSNRDQSKKYQPGVNSEVEFIDSRKQKRVDH
ncbi:uncharacterized protein MELLADRAFT_107828 [Melampsora larici-populina 98AG31]|uniref:Uncharacterized protein n=1 Tax=Melampsora larici-populina (strain 98AG31 / pathotype 3-4-7) TaxID=747676 RepID=F4RR26_MELLP|nr:uncharacterized protein MELLADRAFT_107828 [Melampsora larici-populina 98AG31]EGG05137.1 hypothetical protein MELLADRAFT_107828 [Melampsora larici-populina 98AG31]